MTSDTTGRRVAIIGGGVAGSLAAIALAKLPAISEIVIFDRNDAFGRGLAYSAEAPWHRINVPAYKMGGIGADDPEGFDDWLKSTGQADWPDYAASFVPRRVYGDYIAAQLAPVIANGRATKRVDSVTDIVPQDGAYALATASGDRLTADLVFLCLGNPAPASFASIDESERMITDVWAPGARDAIGHDDRVLIIGTGATAVDMVIELVRRGIRAPMTMISRRGLLPLIDAPAETDPAPLETWPVPTTRGVFADLLRDTRRKVAAGVPWQTMIDTFRPQIGPLWMQAAQSERDRFSRHLRAIWMVHRHRLAPDVAEQLGALQQAHRLDVIAGRIMRATATATGHDVSIRKRSGASLQLATNWILNCTGPQEHYNRIANPLVKAMLASGMARPGDNDLGLDVDAGCQLRGRGGDVHRGLYAIGHATRGAFWEVTAASNIRQQVLDIAAALSV